MTGFETDWLRLREPYDHAARSADLDQAFAEAVRAARAGRPATEPVRLVDLGGGIGNTVRALAPVIGGSQSWTVVDHDTALISALRGVMAEWAEGQGYAATLRGGRVTIQSDALDLTVEGRPADLNRDALSEVLAEADAVTASALLDLVSESWLERLAPALSSRPALFALSYDGGMSFDPSDPLDADVIALFNAHQRGDKSFGPALGPDAVQAAARVLAAHGFTVRAAASPWHLTGSDRVLLGDLVEGFATAASEMAPARRDEIAAWRMRRHATIEAGGVSLMVGHADLLAIPSR